MPETLHVHGAEIEVDPRAQLEGGGARFDVEGPEGRKWRIDVTPEGNYTLVTSWNSEGNLADLDEPDWFDDMLVQLRRGATA
jgi:hypothetical protein